MPRTFCREARPCYPKGRHRIKTENVKIFIICRAACLGLSPKPFAKSYTQYPQKLHSWIAGPVIAASALAASAVKAVLLLPDQIMTVQNYSSVLEVATNGHSRYRGSKASRLNQGGLLT